MLQDIYRKEAIHGEFIFTSPYKYVKGFRYFQTIFGIASNIKGYEITEDLLITKVFPNVSGGFFRIKVARNGMDIDVLDFSSPHSRDARPCVSTNIPLYKGDNLKLCLVNGMLSYPVVVLKYIMI
ncbi:MAG: hypothetical protein HQK79_20205 [Desulfobacterales bacterium]|nr:hypothetical protein [Desulfobacterales bacterium]